MKRIYKAILYIVAIAILAYLINKKVEEMEDDKQENQFNHDVDEVLEDTECYVINLSNHEV